MVYISGTPVCHDVAVFATITVTLIDCVVCLSLSHTLLWHDLWPLGGGHDDLEVDDDASAAPAGPGPLRPAGPRRVRPGGDPEAAPRAHGGATVGPGQEAAEPRAWGLQPGVET